MAGLAAITLVLTVFALSFAFYGRFTNEARQSLKTLIAPFADENSSAITQKLSAFIGDRTRISVIDGNGTVLFDNAADVAALENHSDRREFIAAAKYGAGESKRFSNALKTETYYYAIRLKDGAILRAAITTNSVFGAFAGGLPIIAGIVAVAIALSFIMADRLTRKIVDPINGVDINSKFEAPYKELSAFAETIAAQRERIELELSEKTKLIDLRREFSANVSHELKTPLTSIYGYAEMLCGGMVSKCDRREFYAKIKDEAARLIALIEDIMMISELDEGKRNESFEMVDLREIATATIDALAFKAADNEVVASVEGEGVMRANRSMMFEALYNLADNAIKYNKRGGSVKIKIRSTEKHTAVRVSDSGIGIPKEARNRIFERFYRVDKSRSKKTGGTGLGLAIVKHIALFHGGSIKVKSKEGKGASITLLFSVAKT
jgi:two-component system phosphate regulon sensor histidine kinase PhoR